MMWDFGKRSQDNLHTKAKGRSRSRSRSPQPPQMRIPSPSFPVAQANSHHSPTTYTYGATLTPTAPYPQVSPSSYRPPSPSYHPPSPSYRPPSPYRAPSPSYRAPSPSYPPPSPSYPRAPSPSPYSYNMSHNYPSIPRSVPPVAASQAPHFPQAAPQVIHVIHHSSHHSHSNSHSSSPKHGKHKPHYSYSYSPTNPSSAAMPMPMANSSSYYSAPSPTVQQHHHHSQQKHHSQQQQHQPSSSPNHRVHFPSPSQLVTQPSVLHKPALRARVHSQPTMPSAMVTGGRTPTQAPAQIQGYRPVVQQQQQPLDHNFQYSKCTGRKKALCIGINYKGQENELRGCVNDAKHVRDFLIKQGGYKAADIVTLTDDSRDPRGQPTRKNIIDAMGWLVRHAQTNDSLFFHYSGHGGQTRDLDGDEVDGWDEVIFPLDYKTKGHILDDLMHEIMVKPLPVGCRLTGLFDACHSGTVLDLPYIYSSHGRLKGSHVSSRARAKKATPADVISWSGCKDGQTSADTFSGGVAVGAMSNAFVRSLTENPNQTYQELLRSVRLILHPRYSQRPQLGSSHHIMWDFWGGSPPGDSAMPLQWTLDNSTGGSVHNA